MIIPKLIMLPQPKYVGLIESRTFKNFGHRRQPIPLFTTLWHGSLTLTFIGTCLNWDKFSTWVFGGDKTKLEDDWDVSEAADESV